MKNLIDTVKSGHIISKYDVVKLPTGEKAYIYGFIPYNSSPFSFALSCPPLGKAIIIGNRCISNINGNFCRFPIFASVRQITKKKYPLYLLYVPRLIELSNQEYVKYYMDCYRTSRFNFKINKIEGVEIEDNNAFYKPEDLDMEFNSFVYSSYNRISGIGNGFVVITYKHLEREGVMIYEVYDALDLELFERERNPNPFEMLIEE